jgi:hypothetical protein
MEEMRDWNNLTTEECIEHLEDKFKFDSIGTAKAVFVLINAYKALTIPVVVKSFPKKYCSQCGEPIKMKHKFWCSKKP